MGRSYAVTWKDASGALDSGALTLGENAIELEAAERRKIPYEQLAAVTLGRGTGERLGGRMTVILGLSDGSRLLVAPVAERAALLELAERLTALAVLERG
jgi:hypothetical protein